MAYTAFPGWPRFIPSGKVAVFESILSDPAVHYKEEGGSRTAGCQNVNTSSKPLILIVDDEEDVRSIVRLMLENDGFQVMDASGGREALQIASNADNAISLLITDVLMPQMNGRDLANRIASIRPGIKVLFISAYSAEILSNYQIDPERTEFLRKPFDKKALLARIDKLLPHRLLNAVVPKDEKQLATGFGAQALGQETSPRSVESPTDA